MNGDTLRTAKLIIGLSLLAIVTITAVWDIVVSIRFDDRYTVSGMLREWSREWPLLPLSLGLVMGHIFWR